MKIEGKMSQRLITIAEMLRGEHPVDTVADVGCDHGYVSIYLVQNNIAGRAIAMDVRKGPLSGALSNIKDYGLEDRIATRLSDGLRELKDGEADALVIAGMGGGLMTRILNDRDIRSLGIKKAILQPQSELCEFRRYIRSMGYSIIREKVIFEDGKYYFPMEIDFTKGSNDRLEECVRQLTEKTGCDTDCARSLCDRFGESNILRKDALLKDFVSHGTTVNESILGNLSGEEHPERYNRVAQENEENRRLLFYLINK